MNCKIFVVWLQELNVRMQINEVRFPKLTILIDLLIIPHMYNNYKEHLDIHKFELDLSQKEESETVMQESKLPSSPRPEEQLLILWLFCQKK